MRLRHDWIEQLLLAPSGPPMSRALQAICVRQLTCYGLLLLQLYAAWARGQLVGHPSVGASLAGLCAGCVGVAWRSRPAFAQLMAPVALLHLVIAALHALPLLRWAARQRFGFLGLAVPALLHFVAAVLAAMGLQAAASAGAVAARRVERREPPAPFSRSLTSPRRAPALVGRGQAAAMHRAPPMPPLPQANPWKAS
mmetsp:Transcript_24745/g.79519  ORF Transcript_24745/g.79519 Transcript_24745/m.79519 type:complete len:197 (-) Transcript_24745:255-845(-)